MAVTRPQKYICKGRSWVREGMKGFTAGIEKVAELLSGCPEVVFPILEIRQRDKFYLEAHRRM